MLDVSSISTAVANNHTVVMLLFTFVKRPSFVVVAGSTLLSLASTMESQERFDSPALGSAVSVRTDRNDQIYYRNKFEYSAETGALFVNIPFVFDAFVGGDYSQRPLHYTLVPIFPSLRWHMGKLSGPGLLRGNTDLTATFSLTAIPRGPESIYGAFNLGVRRNFVHRNWKTAPYFEARAGAGFINAQEPHGISYAQGQDFTFTLMGGSGFRYNFNPRLSAALGTTYMHVSNLYLSEPKYFNNGINVVGPLIGFNMRIGKAKASPPR